MLVLSARVYTRNNKGKKYDVKILVISTSYVWLKAGTDFADLGGIMEVYLIHPIKIKQLCLNLKKIISELNLNYFCKYKLAI